MNKLEIRSEHVTDIRDNIAFIEAVINFKNPPYTLKREELLKGFAFIKQGTEGDCSISSPPFFSIANRKKFNAWKELRGMSMVEAQSKFIEFTAHLERKYAFVQRTTRRIDTHHHIVPDFYAMAVKEAGGDPSGYPTPVWSLEQAKLHMRAMDIGYAVISITSPGAVIFEGEKGRQLARQLNDYMAEMVQSKPNQFGFFATLPSLIDLDGALTEINYAFDSLKADGVCVFTHYGHEGDHRYLGHESFRPIWANLNKRNAVVFTHPSHAPSPMVNKYLPQPFIDYPHETTRAAADLVLTGTCKDYPNIKFILSHAGGTLPFLDQRIAGAGFIPFLNTPLTSSEHMKGFRSFYYDTALSTTPAQLKALLEIADPEKILFGSDVPYAPLFVSKMLADSLDEFIKGQPNGKELLEKINRSNAEKLFNRVQ